MGHFLLVRILQALSARAPGFEENARLPSFNECRSTSESKQSVFPGFYNKIRPELIDQKRQKTTSM